MVGVVASRMFTAADMNDFFSIDLDIIVRIMALLDVKDLIL